MFEPEFLVYSNLAFLLPIAVLLGKSWRNKFHFMVVIAFYASAGLFSAFHHRCDTPQINECLHDKHSMYLLDVLFSYIAIAITFSPFFTGWTLNLYNFYAIVGPVVMTLFFGDDYYVAIVLVAVGITCFGLSQFTAWLTNLKEHWELIPATLVFIAAIVFKTQSDKYAAGDDDYVWAHSFWHICIAVAPAILFLDLPIIDSYKYSELGTSSKRVTIMGV